MTSWMLLLGTSIILPILILLGSMTRDLSGRIGVADGERQGLTTLAALGTLFGDASAFAAGSCGPGLPGGRDAIARDVAALNGLEAAHPLGRADWKAAAQTFGPATAPRGSAGFVDSLVALSPVVSDRSGITYDPDVPGIDLADSLTYRLPIAIQQLQRAQSVLCSPGAGRVAGRLALSESVGHAQGYLADGLSETREAANLNPEFAASVGRAQAAAAARSARALASVAAFESHPNHATQAKALADDRRALADLYALMRATGPAIGRLIDERRSALEFRRFETIVLGIISMVAAALIVLFGVRNALHRAELGRVRRTAVELRHHATHDNLTGLPNRTALVTAVDAHLEIVELHGGAVAVLFIDLDNFKLVNDSLGHEAGDSVLCSVSRRLETIARDAGDAHVARFGGDEFAMVFGDTNAARIGPRLEAVVAAIASALAQPVAIRAPFDQQVVISASVGIAFRDDTSERGRVAADLLREADAAMYEAKASGRARAEMFGPAMRERASRKLTLMSDLRGAAERGELALEFQPCVRLGDGQPIGSEALMRWNHPRLGILMPGAFLPIADESGSLVSLGRWAIEDALRNFAAGAAPAGSIHVNMSVRELLHDSLDHTVGDLLARFGVPPGALAIEVIEGSLIRSGDRAERMLRRLRGMGVKIWIDDFGIEYSSLRYLHKLPIDGVKIDRAFVGGVDGTLAAPSIVRMIVELARSLELGVVAEGVETEGQRRALIDLGCVHGQGYLFAQPMGALPNAPASISQIA
jgi:diguanylate cyclase (GGDEF)-like protein